MQFFELLAQIYVIVFASITVLGLLFFIGQMIVMMFEDF